MGARQASGVVNSNLATLPLSPASTFEGKDRPVKKPGINHWPLRACEQIITGNEGLLGQEHFLIGVTRLRNEALILPDTLD